MGLRQLGRCAYRTAASSSPSVVLNGASCSRPGPSRLLPAILPSTRRLASSGTDGPARPRPTYTRNTQPSAAARPAFKSHEDLKPPRPPPERSPWAAREPGTQPGPSRGRGRGNSPEQSVQNTADLPGLIRWDVNSFLQRNHMKSGPPPKMRLRPSTGRTIQRTNKVTAERAFQSLHRLMAQNKVRADFNMQRFHERPGLKRKRLKSQRWRKRFKVGFQAVVKRVTELRKQGW